MVDQTVIERNCEVYMRLPVCAQAVAKVTGRMDGLGEAGDS